MKTIQLGQVWRENRSGQLYLVTKLYNEVLTQYAMLRRVAASASGESIRVKVQKSNEGATLTGYTFAQDSHDF